MKIRPVELQRERAARQARIDPLTVEAENMVFQGDEVSQGRMLRRADTMSDTETVDWVLADNTIAQVTATQLRAAAREAVDEMGRIWVGTR